MTRTPSSDRLSDQHNVTLVLRLVTDREGQLLHGQIVSALGAPGERFDSWAGLQRLLRAYLISSASSQSPELS